jgi:signal peptidase I
VPINAGNADAPDIQTVGIPCLALAFLFFRCCSWGLEHSQNLSDSLCPGCLSLIFKKGNTMKTPAQLKKWPATLLAIVMPGLGQVFNGELLKGCTLLIFFILIPSLIAWITVHFFDRYLLAGITLAAITALGVYLFAIVDAAKTVGRADAEKRIASYRNGFFYLAFWLVGMTCLFTSDGYLKDRIVHPYKIVGRSMEPQVLRGDYVLVDKTAYAKNSVKHGDIVIHVYPDDRSKVFIRRIQGLPGETVTQPNGEKTIIPHGMILVVGDSHDGQKLQDSRDFGPVDMRDIVGQVKQIYFSQGPDGIRWERIGRMVTPDSASVVDIGNH